MLKWGYHIVACQAVPVQVFCQVFIAGDTTSLAHNNILKTCVVLGFVPRAKEMSQSNFAAISDNVSEPRRQRFLYGHKGMILFKFDVL